MVAHTEERRGSSGDAPARLWNWESVFLVFPFVSEGFISAFSFLFFCPFFSFSSFWAALPFLFFPFFLSFSFVFSSSFFCFDCLFLGLGLVEDGLRIPTRLTCGRLELDSSFSSSESSEHESSEYSESISS